MTLYLLPSLNLKLLPKLNAELKPGTRVVSHAFDMATTGSRSSRSTLTASRCISGRYRKSTIFHDPRRHRRHRFRRAVRPPDRHQGPPPAGAGRDPPARGSPLSSPATRASSSRAARACRRSARTPATTRPSTTSTSRSSGFCFGHQEIAKHYGGKVVHGGREWGRADLHVDRATPALRGPRADRAGVDEPLRLGRRVGPGFEEIGYTHARRPASRRTATRPSDPTALRRYGFQFHPEVDDTVHGDEMIANFVFGICGCRPSWTMERYVEEQVARVREQVGRPGRCSCSPRAAWTRPWPPGCSAWRSAPSACTCCTSTTA